MAHFQVAVLEQLLDVGFQAHQAQQVGHHGAGFTHRVSHLLVGKTEFFLQAAQGDGLFHGIEVFPLDVLDQRHGDGGFVGHLADYRRDGVQLGHLGGTPAAFTGNDLVALFAERAHHDGLHDPLGTDGLGQLFQGIRGHVTARLVTTAFHAVHRQVAQLAITRWILHTADPVFLLLLDPHFVLVLLVGFAAAEQGIQALAETAFTLCRHDVSFLMKLLQAGP